MSALFDPLSGKPVTLIPRAAFVNPDPAAPGAAERAEVPYEIHTVYVMSDLIQVPVYIDDQGDEADSPATMK